MFGDDSYSKLGACVMMNDECWLIVNYVWKNWQLKYIYGVPSPGELKGRGAMEIIFFK